MKKGEQGKVGLKPFIGGKNMLVQSHEAEIEQYLKSKGVTKCPTVCLSKTTASISAYDKRILNRHQEIQNRYAEQRKKQEFMKYAFFFCLGAFIAALTHLGINPDLSP